MSDIEQAARAEAERRQNAGEFYTDDAQSAFPKGASWLAEYLLSDENVEKAARAILPSPWWWSDPSEAREPRWPEEQAYAQDRARRDARAALSAVLGEDTKQNNEGSTNG